MLGPRVSSSASVGDVDCVLKAVECFDGAMAGANFVPKGVVKMAEAHDQEVARGHGVLDPRVACWADALEQQHADEQCDEFLDLRDWDKVFLANSAAAARRAAALDARAAAERLEQDVLVVMPGKVEVIGAPVATGKRGKKEKRRKQEKSQECDCVDLRTLFEEKGTEMALLEPGSARGSFLLAWLEDMQFFEMADREEAKALFDVLDGAFRRGCAAARLSGAAAERTPCAGGPQGATPGRAAGFALDPGGGGPREASAEPVPGGAARPEGLG